MLNRGEQTHRSTNRAEKRLNCRPNSRRNLRQTAEGFLPQGNAYEIEILEARVRIELTHKGFADLSLTTWVPRHPSEIIAKLRKTVSQPRGSGAISSLPS